MTLSLKTLSLRVKVKSFKVLCELDLIPTLPHDLRALSLLFFPVLTFVWPHPPHTHPHPSSNKPDRFLMQNFVFFYSPLCWKWFPHGHLWGFLTPRSLFTQGSPPVSHLWASYFKWRFLPSPSLLSSSPELLSAFNLPRFPYALCLLSLPTPHIPSH